jgi:hypothetical protein
MREAEANRVVVHLKNECGTFQCIGSDREISMVFDKYHPVGGLRLECLKFSSNAKGSAGSFIF